MAGRVSVPVVLECHIRCKCSIETTRYSVKVNIDNRVIKLLESRIGWGVTVTDQGSECHLTVVRGRHHIG